MGNNFSATQRARARDLSVSIGRNHDGISIFGESCSSLSAARMSDDSQTEHLERYFKRDSLRHVDSAVLSSQTFILLLAYVQREFIRQKEPHLQVRR